MVACTNFRTAFTRAGTHYFPNKDKYEGEWAADTMTGKARLGAPKLWFSVGCDGRPVARMPALLNAFVHAELRMGMCSVAQRSSIATSHDECCLVLNCSMHRQGPPHLCRRLLLRRGVAGRPARQGPLCGRCEHVLFSSVHACISFAASLGAFVRCLPVIHAAEIGMLTSVCCFCDLQPMAAVSTAVAGATINGTATECCIRCASWSAALIVCHLSWALPRCAVLLLRTPACSLHAVLTFECTTLAC